MSRWLNDETRIALSPDRVSLARIRHRLRPRVVETFSLEAKSSSSSSEPWRATLEALREIWGRGKPRGRATVLISNAFLRFAIVPWQSSVLRHEERKALARHYLTLRYGDPHSSAAVVVSTPEFGQSSIGCAIDSAFLTGIEREISSRSGEAASIQPLLMSVVNAYARQCKKPSTILAVVESDCATVMFVSKTGALTHVAARRISGDAGEALQAIVNQELAVQSQPFTPERLLLFASEPGTGTPLQLPWRVERLSLPTLPGFVPSNHRESSLVLCGV